MFHALRWQLPMLMLVALLTSGVNAQDKKKPYEKHDASALDASLKEVINAGAKIYNENGDHAGCFRMYQGALVSVRPFLSPELQKKIDAANASCESLGSYQERAFTMRKVLDEIREQFKGPGDGKDKTKEIKGKEKAKETKGATGDVTGTVTYAGKPVAGGYTVRLVSKSGKTSSTPVKDGKFQVQGLTVGEYRIAIEPIADAKLIPARYASESTSGLTIQVQAGKQQVDLSLVK